MDVSNASKGVAPRRLEVDGVRQHEAGQRVQALGRDQGRDLALGLLRDPCIDAPRGLGGRLEVQREELGPEVLRHRVTVGRQDRVRFLDEQGGGDVAVP